MTEYAYALVSAAKEELERTLAEAVEASKLAVLAAVAVSEALLKVGTSRENLKTAKDALRNAKMTAYGLGKRKFDHDADYSDIDDSAFHDHNNEDEGSVVNAVY